MTIRV
jgi:WD40 repeat protein